MSSECDSEGDRLHSLIPCENPLPYGRYSGIGREWRGVGTIVVIGEGLELCMVVGIHHHAEVDGGAAGHVDQHVRDVFVTGEGHVGPSGIVGIQVRVQLS